MIGIYFKQRRREFLEFAAVNPIDYEEILDPADTAALSQYSSIFTDDPTFSVGSFDVIVINSQDISDVFSSYIKKHKLSTVYTKERFYNAIFYYFERVYKKCVPIVAKPIENTVQNKSTCESTAPSILKRSIINQINEISGVTDPGDNIAIDINDLAVENMDDISNQAMEETPIEAEVQVESTPLNYPQESIRQTAYPSEPVQQRLYQPEPVQPFYNQQPVQPLYQQSYGQMSQGYPMPNVPPVQPGFQQPAANQAPWAQQYRQPMPSPDQYQQPVTSSNQYGFNPRREVEQRPPFQQNTSIFAPQQDYMDFNAGFVPAPMQSQAMIPKEPLRTGNVQMRRRGTSAHKRLGAPIYTFSSLTDKAGTTTIAFLLAKTMAAQNPDMKIIYLDLNLSNPNTISNHLGYGMGDATLVNVATATNIDFTANLGLLTDTIQVSDGCTFSMITFGETTFKQKTAFLTIDYSQFLDMLADSFDVVFVDIGKLQGTLAYQHLLMQSPLSKHILVADGSSLKTLNTFITATKGLMYNFEVVVNKSLPTVGTFILNKQLGIAPLGVVGNHNNTMRFITDAVPFDGTAMQKELWILGGAL